MTMLSLSPSVMTAHPEAYSILETLYWTMVRSTDCREEIWKHCQSEHFISFKFIPMGIFSNQLNKSGISACVWLLSLVKTMKNGFIIYFLLKKCFCVKKNYEKHIKIVHGAQFSNKTLIILIDIEIAAHCAGP